MKTNRGMLNQNFFYRRPRRAHEHQEEAPKSDEGGSWKGLAKQEKVDKKGWVVWHGEVLLRQASNKYDKPITLPFGAAVPYNETAAWYKQPGGKDHWFELPLSLPEIEEEIGFSIAGRLFTTRMPVFLDEQGNSDATNREGFRKKCKDNSITNVFCLVEHHEFAEGKSKDLLTFYQSECGLRVFHRPIEDFNCPSFEIEASCIADLNIALKKGEHCLVHCWGGSGRTGTVIIGAMKNLGIKNPIAIARSVKSVYLDIKEQEEFLNKQRIIVTESMVQEFPELANCILLEHVEELITATDGIVVLDGITLPEEEMKAYKTIFHHLDLHGIGKISINEIVAMSQTMKGKKHITADQLQRLFVKMDPSLEGIDPAVDILTFDDFLKLVLSNAQIASTNYEAKRKSQV